MRLSYFLLVALLSTSYTKTVKKSLNPYIFGGFPAKEGQFPYQAFIECSGKHYCDGAILNNRWIITAGHCDKKGILSCLVGFGSTNLDNATKYEIIDFIVYNSIIGVALLKTAQPISFDEKIQPIELSEDFIEGGLEAVLSGWGMTENGPTNELRYINLSIMDLQECLEVWKSRFSANIEVHICTTSPVGVGACFGDSGGPLVVDGKLVGITDFGEPCAKGFPDVFIRISVFKKWIEYYINDSNNAMNE